MMLARSWAPSVERFSVFRRRAEQWHELDLVAIVVGELQLRRGLPQLTEEGLLELSDGLYRERQLRRRYPLRRRRWIYRLFEGWAWRMEEDEHMMHATFRCPECGSSEFGSSGSALGDLQRFCHGTDERRASCRYTWRERDDWKHFFRPFESAAEYAAFQAVAFGRVVTAGAPSHSAPLQLVKEPP